MGGERNHYKSESTTGLPGVICPGTADCTPGSTVLRTTDGDGGRGDFGRAEWARAPGRFVGGRYPDRTERRELRVITGEA